MSRLIDADTLKETIASNVYPVADAFNSRDYGMFWTGGIEKAIDEQPTIDAVPVIRCKDCKYSSDNGVYGCRIESFDYDFDTRMYANDFCSCGKKEK